MGSLGSIISAFIKYSLWTSTSQAAMQHNIEHIIPTPILIRVTCCCVAFLEQNKNDIMKRIEDLRANKLFKGMWTLLPMPKSKLLVNLFKKESVSGSSSQTTTEKGYPNRYQRKKAFYFPHLFVKRFNSFMKRDNKI